MPRFQRELSALQGEHLTFFELELVQLSDETLKNWYESDPIWSPSTARGSSTSASFKPHFLSEPVESALTKRSPFDSSSWGEFFDEVEADLEFNFRGATTKPHRDDAPAHGIEGRRRARGSA